MKDNSYEFILHEDMLFPILMHTDTLTKDTYFIPHWHESLELLYFLEGKCSFISSGVAFKAKKGDIAIVNSDTIHDLRCEGDENTTYICLIIDSSIASQLNIDLSQISFKNVIFDKEITDIIINIQREYNEENPYYKAKIKVLCSDLLVQLCRKHLWQGTVSHTSRNLMVKEGIRFMRQHFREKITLDMVANSANASKFHFCREFKEVTEYSVIDYLNFIRLSYAKSLLESGMYNVGEVAFKSGFNNISYFTKMYKKYFNVLPSKVK